MLIKPFIILLACLKTNSSLSIPPITTSSLQTTSDLSIERWSSSAGIVRVGVGVRTGDASVGGRGIFALSDIREGSVVASVPKDLVLSAEGEGWAGEITRLVKGLKGGVGGEQDARREWVEGWRGGGCKSWEDVVERVGGESVFEGREGLRERVKLRLKDRLDVFSKIDYLEDSDLELYAMVCSRACYLGPSWSNAVGVVPYFDFLNHVDDGKMVNVGLESFGQVLSRAPEGPGRPDPGMMDEQDMLIIAKRDVKEGEELLTSYVDEDDEGGDVRKIVTWGFIT